jgi:hypothetical protein
MEAKKGRESVLDRTEIKGTRVDQKLRGESEGGCTKHFFLRDGWNRFQPSDRYIEWLLYISALLQRRRSGHVLCIVVYRQMLDLTQIALYQSIATPVRLQSLFDLGKNSILVQLPSDSPPSDTRRKVHCGGGF